jgi:hypothetical protein
VRWRIFTPAPLTFRSWLAAIELDRHVRPNRSTVLASIGRREAGPCRATVLGGRDVAQMLTGAHASGSADGTRPEVVPPWSGLSPRAPELLRLRSRPGICGFNRAPNFFRQHEIGTFRRVVPCLFLSIAAVSVIVLISAISFGPTLAPHPSEELATAIAAFLH